MPESSTGGEGGRVNTPAPRVPPNYVQIDWFNDRLILTDSTASFTERILEVTVEFSMRDEGTRCYACESGRVWTIPYGMRSGDLIPARNVTCAMGRAFREDRVDFDRYARGGYVNPPATFRGVGDRITYAGADVDGACPCGMCQAARDATARPGENERQRRQRIDREFQERKAAQRAIEARAEETLRMVLRPDELAYYVKTGRIIVTGADGRKYRIMEGIVGNVWLLNASGNEDEPMASLCCHPNLYASGARGPLPYKDVHIAQILYLRHDIDNFWKTANVSWVSAAAYEYGNGQTNDGSDREAAIRAVERMMRIRGVS